MPEYIEREAAIAETRKPRLTDAELRRRLANIPAADVRPVVHGRWIWDDEGYHCSECFYHAYGETGEVLSGNWHYCPNCGADMREES